MKLDKDLQLREEGRLITVCVDCRMFEEYAEEGLPEDMTETEINDIKTGFSQFLLDYDNYGELPMDHKTHDTAFDFYDSDAEWNDDYTTQEPHFGDGSCHICRTREFGYRFYWQVWNKEGA